MNGDKVSSEEEEEEDFDGAAEEDVQVTRLYFRYIYIIIYTGKPTIYILCIQYYTYICTYAATRRG